MDAFEEPRGINPLGGEALLSRCFLTTRERRGGKRGNGGNGADRRRAVLLALRGLVSSAVVLTMFFATSSSFAEELETFSNSEGSFQNQRSGELPCRRISPGSDSTEEGQEYRRSFAVKDSDVAAWWRSKVGNGAATGKTAQSVERKIATLEGKENGGGGLLEPNHFELESLYGSPDLGLAAHKMTHTPTQATVYHFISLPDKSPISKGAGIGKMYKLSVCLRTPALDDMGLPHIVQSLVVGGSDMLRRSNQEQCASVRLESYITRDFTCYSSDVVAEQEREEVLARLLFSIFRFTNFTEKAFNTGAWRYSPDAADDDEDFPKEKDDYLLEYEGTAYSTALSQSSKVDYAVTEAAIKRLLSDTTFVNSPIGKPEEIPQSKLVDAVAYYNAHYRLDNATFFLSPNEEGTKVLETLDKLFTGLPKPSKPGRAQPATAATYQGKQEGAPSGLTTLNIPTWKDTEKDSLHTFWLLDPVQDMQNPKESLLSNKDRFCLRVIQYLLLKEFSEAGLSISYTQPTSMTSIPQTIFGFVVHGVDELGAKNADELIMETLKKIVANGFSEGLVEDVLSYLEVQIKKPRSYHSPLSFIFVRDHFAGREPFIEDIEALFAEVRAALRGGNGRLFEEYIDRFFVSNPCRVALWANTSEEQMDREANERMKKLETLKMSMSSKEFRGVMIKDLQSMLRLLDPKRERILRPQVLPLPSGVQFLNGNQFGLMGHPELQDEKKIGEARIFKLLLDVKNLAFLDFAISVDNFSVSEIRLLNVLINLMYNAQDKQRGYGKSGDPRFQGPSAPSAARVEFETVRKVLLGQPLKGSEAYKSNGFFFFHGSAKPTEFSLVAEQFSVMVADLKVEDQGDCLSAVDALKAQIRYEMQNNGDVLIGNVGKGLTDESMALKTETMGGATLNQLRQFRKLIKSDWAKARSELQTVHDKLMKTKTISIIVSSSSGGLRELFNEAAERVFWDKLREQQARAVETADTENPVWAQEIRQREWGLFGNRSVEVRALTAITAMSLQFPLFKDGEFIEGRHILASFVLLKYYSWRNSGGAMIPYTFDPFSGHVHITIKDADPMTVVQSVLRPMIKGAEALPGNISEKTFEDLKLNTLKMLENQVFPEAGTSGAVRIQQEDQKSVEIAFRKMKQEIIGAKQDDLKYFYHRLRLSLQSPENMWFAYLTQNVNVQFSLIDLRLFGSWDL